ncbi:SDR family oxidoreductase [Pseudoteredinibacter isoporae]|uniref:SDR family oxidoreductase n=1 Tax=Pseudoteredinibacter isoporae TaxID=570281 RepID=UPI00310937C7
MAKIFITGASSGLGWYMALEFARRGHGLALAARRMEKLEELADRIRREFQVEVYAYTLDVRDEEAQRAVMAQARQDLHGLDVIIANAGIGESSPIGKGDFSSTRATIEVNVIAAMATLHHGVELLREQGAGQLVAISSVAGERGMPGAADYCASKAAISCYTESLRLECLNENIDITLLKPGYIDTPINQGAASRPFLVGPEVGARALVDAIEAKCPRSYIPSWPWCVVARLLKWLPGRLLAKSVG